MIGEKRSCVMASGAMVTSKLVLNLQATPCTGGERSTVPRAMVATWPAACASSWAMRTIAHEGNGRK